MIADPIRIAPAIDTLKTVGYLLLQPFLFISPSQISSYVAGFLGILLIFLNASLNWVYIWRILAAIVRQNPTCSGP